MPSSTPFANQIIAPQPLRFLWLELTNRCNLECVHCYADSRPHPDRKDLLTPDDYNRLISDAASLGCRSLQFIGGEPTLHKELPALIEKSRASNFEFVEVYTNGTNLSDSLLACFKSNNVNVAVSLYADDPAIHDAITTRGGSHTRTIRNLRRMVEAGLEVRVGVISMEANKNHVAGAMSLANELGIEHVGVDYARGFGRGADISSGPLGLQSLCGACWQGSACIAPDGGVSPCIMSKAWSVGSVIEKSLLEIISGEQLASVREQIYSAVWLKQRDKDITSLDDFDEDTPCGPCDPNCRPCEPRCGPSCQPICTPFGKLS
jgi:MoaA/NifB/PqqE/SkfB family radical SAM enzyme